MPYDAYILYESFKFKDQQNNENNSIFMALWKINILPIAYEKYFFFLSKTSSRVITKVFFQQNRINILDLQI